ncbi:MAG: hypothetical protein V2I31_03185 [Mariniphaga sp.]|jgi:hypothetical protein|nr:hypothetical protein [Mariniphaga sp.]
MITAVDFDGMIEEHKYLKIGMEKPFVIITPDFDTLKFQIS